MFGLLITSEHFKKILREFDFERRLRILNDKLSMGIELQGRLFEFSNSVGHQLLLVMNFADLAHQFNIWGYMNRNIPIGLNGSSLSLL
jgi:hypothetical protein